MTGLDFSQFAKPSVESPPAPAGGGLDFSAYAKLPYPEPNRQAKTSKVPPQSVGQELLQGVERQMMAAGQMTSPIVRDAEGTLNYPRRGLAVDTDAGTMVDPGTGDFEPIDRQRNVMLTDPKSGEMSVFDRTPETDEGRMSAAGRLLTLGMNAPTSIGPMRGMQAVKAPQTTERQKLLADYSRVGVDPSLPGLSSRQGVFTAPNIAQRIAETPVVGQSVLGPVQEQLGQMKQAASAIAGQYGKTSTPDEAGRVLSEGVTRYARGRGIAPTTATAPSRLSSFKDKAAYLEDVVNKAGGHNAQVPLTNTMAEMQRVLGPTSNQVVNEIMADKSIASVAQRLQEGGPLSYNDARKFRTWFREGNLKEGSLLRSVPEADLGRIYEAMTADIRAGLQATSPNAVKAFDRATNYYRAGAERIKTSLQTITKAPSEEAAYAKLDLAARDKGGNLSLLHAVRRSVRDDEWGDIAATMIERLGNVGRQGLSARDETFSPAQFVNNYMSMSPKARAVLFNGAGQGELYNALNSLARVAEGGKNLEKVANKSMSGVSLQLGGIGAGLMMKPHIVLPLLAAEYGVGKAMMNPKFVRWMADSERKFGAAARSVTTLQAQATAMGDALAGSLARLRLLAAEDPQLSQQVGGLYQALSAAAEEEAAKAQLRAGLGKKDEDRLPQ